MHNKTEEELHIEWEGVIGDNYKLQRCLGGIAHTYSFYREDSNSECMRCTLKPGDIFPCVTLWEGKE